MSRFSNVTPQQKIEAVSDKLGIPGIKKQQGTTRIIYDTLPIDGRTTFRFFEGSGSRNFPSTNLGSFGNKLEVGETLTVQYAYLSLITFETPEFLIVNQIDTIPIGGPNVQITGGDMNFSIGNVQVIKPMPVASSVPQFNKNCNDASSLFIFDTDLVIPPLLEFVAELRTAGASVGINQGLRLTIEGIGSIINTRRTY